MGISYVDPYGEPHQDYLDCPWCWLPAKRCPECGEIIHNYFVDGYWSDSGYLINVKIQFQPHIHRINATVIIPMKAKDPKWKSGIEDS